LDRLLPSDKKAAYTKSQPLGRFGHVRDIADATVYLFSDAGSYVTGQTLVGKSSSTFQAYFQKRKANIVVVDGANWRTSGGMGSNGNVPYPDILLSGEEIANVTGKKKSKL
jgi:peroxisomal 2,4-dienoyl-CoA reductase